MLNAIEKNHIGACVCHVKRYDIGRTKFDDEEPFNHATQKGKNMVYYIEWTLLRVWSFQAYKHPCSHVIVVCAHVNISMYKYVDKVYKIKNIIQAYFGNWNPFSCEETIPKRSDPVIVKDES